MSGDEISALFREAQARGLYDGARTLLERHREDVQKPVDWHRRAGRALAEEGLATNVLRQEIDRWIDREREALRSRLRGLLGATGVK